MKTSTAFCCDIPSTEQEFNTLIYSLLEHDINYQNDYGLQKIWHNELNDYVGVAGLIRCKKKINGFDNDVVEIGIFMIGKYLIRGYGVYIVENLFQKAFDKQNIVIASIWEKNKSCLKIALKNGMQFLNKTIKSINDKIIDINVYIKYPFQTDTISANIDNILITNIINNDKKDKHL